MTALWTAAKMMFTRRLRKISKKPIDAKRLRFTLELLEDRITPTVIGTGGSWSDAYTDSSGVYHAATITFDPSGNDAGSMGGDGSFVANTASELIIPASFGVSATNFYLTGGTITGGGNFYPQFLAWSGGTMGGPESTGGTTVVTAGAQLIISDDVTLDNWTIDDQGSATWQYSEESQTIRMYNNAEILVDGGQFNTYNVNGTIASDGSPFNLFVLQKGGSFLTNATEIPGTITIEVAFLNNGGQCNIETNTTFTVGLQNYNGGQCNIQANASFAFYSQSGAGSQSIFGSGTYQLSAQPNNQVFNGGTVQLQGGTLNGVIGLTNTTFNGYGTIIGLFMTNESTMTLTGNLSCDVSFSFFNGTTTNLGGFQLSAVSISNSAGCAINEQGGTLVGAVTGDGIINP